MDFRKVFDRELLACGDGTFESASMLPNHADSASTTEGTTGSVRGASDSPAMGSAGSDHPSWESFPASKFESFGTFDSDLLTIMSWIPDGKIPGLQYVAKEGAVYIRKGVRNREGILSKFQDVYQESGRKLKREVVPFAIECSGEEIAKILEDFHTRYPNCHFCLTGEPRGVKILSTSSRQFDTAKKLLIDQIMCLPQYSTHLRGGQVLTLKKADIVAEGVDAIVNAANGLLDHCGGVAAAINRASNGEVQRHSMTYMRSGRGKNQLKVGSVVATPAGGSLKCKHVLHAVGPTSHYHDCEGALRHLVRNILNEAKKSKIRSIAIPAISSGIFGVDKNLVARCIMETLAEYPYPPNSDLISDVRVVIIDQPTYQCFVSRAQRMKLFPPPSVKKAPAKKVDSSTERDDFGAMGSGAVEATHPPSGRKYG
jgi:O-acetyl-ADP-ribose deacetylase (regulator of RNase III)